jgi:hypothetical protein
MLTAFYPRSHSEPSQDNKRGGKGGRDWGGNEEADFYPKPTQESPQIPYRRASGVVGWSGEEEAGGSKLMAGEESFHASTDFYVCLEDWHT